MAWAIEFDPDALKDLKKLDKPVQLRIVGFLKTRVARLERLARRIVVRVLRVGNRREVYR